MKKIFLLILITFNLHAQVLKKDNNGDFVLLKKTFMTDELLQDYAKHLDLNLSVDSDFKAESFTAEGSMLIKNENLENYVSLILSQSSYGMIRMKDSSFVKVINARDSRFTPVSVYDRLEDIPQNDFYSQFSFTLKYLKAGQLTRNMRPFLSRYGRIIDVENSNSVHLIEQGHNLQRIIKIAMYLDTKEYAEGYKEVEKLNEKFKKVIKKEKSFLEIISSYQGLFIMTFLILGIILGFGIRGYMMKKIEGGW